MRIGFHVGYVDALWLEKQQDAEFWKRLRNGGILLRIYTRDAFAVFPFPIWWREFANRLQGLWWRLIHDGLRVWWVPEEGGYYRDGFWVWPRQWKRLAVVRMLDIKRAAEWNERKRMIDKLVDTMIEQGWTW